MRRSLGVGQARPTTEAGQRGAAVRGHAGRRRSTQWRARSRPVAQLAAAPRTEGANQGWRTCAAWEQGPQPASAPHPTTRKVPQQMGCRREMRACQAHLASLEGLHCNARGALVRVQNVRLAKRPCAPAEGKLRTSAGHSARARSARGMPRGAAGVRQECWRCGLAWLNTSATDARASRMRKYRISGGGLYQVTRYQPDYQPDGVSTLIGG